MDATAGGPGYYSTEEVAKLQSRIFETKTESLIWQPTAQSTDPKSTKDVVESLGDLVIKSLKDNNLPRR
jgi:hypothetical protein